MEATDKNFKKTLIETFRAFDKFCKEHDIKYFIAYGSLIGAVRHQGLIPWDDDIDVWMLPDDYKKFCSYRGRINDHYDIVDEREENYWLLTLAKFVDTDTTLWEMEVFRCVTGIYIDVFPLYVCDTDISCELKCRYEKTAADLKRSEKKYSLQKITSTICTLRPRSILHMLTDLFRYVPMRKYFRRRYENCFNEIRPGTSNSYVSFEGDWKEKEVFPMEWFADTVIVNFEDMEIEAPAAYHEILTQIYGDYMQLPPEEKRKSHHPHYFVDLTRRWTIDEIKKYKRIHKG